ncbi:vomeronasal type-2 receptor 26-like [Ascaphus truei]|uniref:vomeronasal type-2 receptor 26-like n=1 Tax=Ascaphus truei TaxID=8439 RepID=UPI003F5A45E0
MWNICFPQVSYGSMDPIFNDRLQFPYLFRTVPNERNQHQAIVQLLQQFGWTWVGILASDDDNSQTGSQELKDLITSSGGCVAFLHVISKKVDFLSDTLQDITYSVANSSARVVISYCASDIIREFMMLYSTGNMQGKVWIISASVSFFTNYITPALCRVLNGSLSFSVHKGEIPGFKDFLINWSPYKDPDDFVLSDIWMGAFKCVPIYSIDLSFLLMFPNCTGNETLQSLPPHVYDVENFRMTYSIYTAVHALAQALHVLFSVDSSLNSVADKASLKNTLHPWQLSHYLKNVHFTSASGEEIFFTSEGDVPGKYDIINWFISHDYRIPGVKVGSFNPSSPGGEQLIIKKNIIQWHPDVTEEPLSVCSDSCDPGYRKAPREGQPACCYVCVRCAEGEISNTTDAENCVQCPEDQWSNKERDRCVLRTIVFISYVDPLGSSLASISILCCVITCAVLGIFITHHETPIVKSNNQIISYILLLSLMLSFLCPLLFIGRPGKGTCLLRQAAFGIIFTVSVSSVLAKSVTVVIAFNATKPGSRIKKWVGSRVSICLVLLCSLGEVVICMVWLAHSPPFPDYDTQSDTGKMILQCNEGSVAAFYIVIGYMGFLSVLSFIVAFLVRKLPASFNEAQLITFSMLVFCSVWVSFIPAYLSAKGRNTVAVEIFAILASSAGLLGCIFIPKCYTILLRPELNTREHVIGKH